ncbi:TetR/AcrR family transcriptional regulator [bacterium]|nr:TetR/AcrR family transcriptional regulator [bacterium]
MEETRNRLIEGARRWLIENGHQEFSVRKAARCAGINHGMVHHLFGSKEKLVLAVLEHELGKHVDSMDDRTGEVGNILNTEEAEKRKKMLAEHLMKDDDHVALLREMLSLAEEMPAVKTMLAGHLRLRREQIASRLGSRDPGAAALFMAAIMGLHFLRAIDPELPVEAAVESLWQLGKKLANGATEK